jgi:cardiolipin synthase
MLKLNFSAENHLSLLHTGAEYFSALEQAIDEAQHTIYLETYIFASDATGQRIIYALQRARQRECDVRVIIDWLGSGSQYSIHLKDQLEELGIACRLFNPWFRRGLSRTHRKLAIIDKKIAFIGGINIIDDLPSQQLNLQTTSLPRWDFAVQVQGHLVQEIEHEVRLQWLKLGKLKVLDRLQLFRQLRKSSKHLLLDRHSKKGLAALVIRDNLRNRSTIQKSYLKAIGEAKQSVILANPYFSPSGKFRRALIAAAQRGIKVQLLLGVGEFAFQDAITSSFYPSLLKHGIEISEYHLAQLHGKVAVVDEDWATVGSSNIDGLSLFVNHEANLIILDRHFTHDLQQHLNIAFNAGQTIHLDDYAKRPWYRRAWHGLAYLLYRSLMRIATFGRYD